jgi:hypothetical protein
MPVSSTRSTNILDSMNKSSRKSSALNRAANNEKSPVIKPLIPKPKSKQVLFQLLTSVINSMQSVGVRFCLLLQVWMGGASGLSLVVQLWKWIQWWLWSSTFFKCIYPWSWGLYLYSLVNLPNGSEAHPCLVMTILAYGPNLPCSIYVFHSRFVIK